MATVKWYDITQPSELVEAIENIRREADLGQVRMSVPRGRIDAFEENGLISSQQAEELREHLNSLSKKKK